MPLRGVWTCTVGVLLGAHPSLLPRVSEGELWVFGGFPLQADSASSSAFSTELQTLGTQGESN